MHEVEQINNLRVPTHLIRLKNLPFFHNQPAPRCTFRERSDNNDKGQINECKAITKLRIAKHDETNRDQCTQPTDNTNIHGGGRVFPYIDDTGTCAKAGSF